MKNNILSSVLIFNTLALFGSAESNINTLSKQLKKNCVVSDINEKTGKYNHTRLMRAASRGNNDEVLQLLLQKANPYIQSNHGETALIFAAYKGHPPVVLTLLALCDNKEKILHQKLSNGKTAIDYAKEKKHSKVIEILTHAQNQVEFGTTCMTHFSPNILQAVLNCINNEQEGVTGAMYSFTHGDPARACVKQKDKGVHVELIVDKDYTYNTSSKSFDKNKKANICVALRYMTEHGIDMYECNLGSNKSTNNGYFNMHNKFLVFQKNAKDKPLLITGSCNFTHQAFTKNWENIIIIDDADAIASFLEHYKTMKKSAIPLPPERCRSEKDTDYWACKNNRVEHLL